jgi:hypothetical protein
MLVTAAAVLLLGVFAAAAGAAPQAEVTGPALVVGHGSFEVTGITVFITAAVVRSAEGRVYGFFRTFSPGFGGATVRATCLRIEGGRALIGGTITQSSAPGQVGTPSALVVDDRSHLGAPPSDRVIVGVGPTADQCSISPAAIAGPFDELTSGNFIVFAR